MAGALLWYIWYAVIHRQVSDIGCVAATARARVCRNFVFADGTALGRLGGVLETSGAYESMEL